MEDQIIIKRKRGRPCGHRLSEETKDRIRQKRMGCCHTKKTKDKISRSLVEYFRKRDALSLSLANEYSYVSDEAVDWICEHREDIDKIEHVMTERRLMYLRQIEICIGSDIEYLFGHNITPEFLILLKEELQEEGQNELELHSLV